MEKKKKNTEVEAEVTENAVTEESTTPEVDLTAKLQEELDQQKDLLLRTAAEYDNFKKRTAREKEELANFTKCSLCKQLLPALDNFERAAAAETTQLDEYKKGMEMSVKQLTDALEKFGLKEIECEGKPFDPNFHYAVSKTEDESFEPNTVATVLQKGFVIGETVVRPAMVVVANCD